MKSVSAVAIVRDGIEITEETPVLVHPCSTKTEASRMLAIPTVFEGAQAAQRRFVAKFDFRDRIREIGSYRGRIAQT